MPEELSDMERARALLAASALWTALDAIKERTDIITYTKIGGLQLEDFADAIDRGGDHPLFSVWQERKSATNRPAPGLREQHARRLAVLLCIALERIGLRKCEARKKAAQALANRGLFATEPVPGALKHWKGRMHPPLTDMDERVISTAIARSGSDPQRLTDYFVGLVRLSRDPFVPEVPPVMG